METEELVSTEVAEQVSEHGSHGMKTVAVAGVSMVAGALLWNYVVKPLGKKIKHGVQAWKASRTQVKEPVAEVRKPKN